MYCILFAITIFTTTNTILAQCPMCKAALESNMKEGGKTGLGINDGILYLLFAPYLIVMVIGIIWWKNKKALEKQEKLELNS